MLGKKNHLKNLMKIINDDPTRKERKKEKPVPEGWRRCSKCSKCYTDEICTVHEMQCELLNAKSFHHSHNQNKDRRERQQHQFDFAETMSFASKLKSNKFSGFVDGSYEGMARRKTARSKGSSLPEFHEFLFGEEKEKPKMKAAVTGEETKKLPAHKANKREEADKTEYERNESEWAKFTAVTSRKQKLSFSDVPMFRRLDFSYQSIFGLHPAKATVEEKRARMRCIMLRWHPDKFAQAYGSRLDDEEREAVMEGVKRVFQRINELKKL